MKMTLALYSYRNLWVRKLTTVLTAGGMGLVVFVFATVLMLAEGLEATLVSTGARENVMFIRRASEVEVQSMINRDEASILESVPGIDTDRDGRKLAARELVVLIGLRKKGAVSLANVTVRGVEPGVSFALRPNVRIVSGRPFSQGRAEVVIGKSLAKRFSIGGLGETMSFGARAWSVVGILDASGAAFDSEIWGDIDLLMATFRRPVYSSMLARLSDASSFPGFKESVLRDPRLTVDVWRESEYYGAQSALMARFIRILGITLTFIFSLGAVIGAMVTMYAAVAGRTAEIGTLRALGFGRWTILATFLAESLLLGALGGVVGLAAASLLDRFTISTMNWQTFSELSFRFTLNRAIVGRAMVFSVAMGVVGGMLPAARAARLGIVEALRSQ